VNLQVRSATRLALTALLLGAAAVGCAGHAASGAGGPAVSATTAQPGRPDRTMPTLAATPNDSVAADATTPGPTTAAGETAAAGPTADPLNSQLSNLDDLLNGIDSSLSASAAGASGGE